MPNFDHNTHSSDASRCLSKNHIPALDGLRGIAILMVMSHHFNILAHGSPVERLLTATLETGWAGVDLFFVLSGFLITGILIDSKENAHYYRNFYIRRSLRIFPLYYAVVLLTFMVLPQLPGSLAQTLSQTEGGIGWYLTYLSNFAMTRGNHFGFGMLNVTWSLAVEEQFYLVWPLIVYALPQRGLLRLCLVLIVAVPMIRIGLVWQSVSWVAVYTLPFCQLDALAIGAVIAIALRSEFWTKRAEDAARGVLVLSVLGLMTTLTMNRNTHPAASPWMLTLGFSSFACLFGASLTLILTSSRWRPVSALLANPLLVLFGKYSYGLYLIHVPVRNAVIHFAPGIASSPSLLTQIAFWLLSAGLSLLLAIPVWYAIEQPFLKLKDRFPTDKVPKSRKYHSAARQIAPENSLLE